jgi:hypothetical protein
VQARRLISKFDILGLQMISTKMKTLGRQLYLRHGQIAVRKKGVQAD